MNEILLHACTFIFNISTNRLRKLQIFFVHKIERCHDMVCLNQFSSPNFKEAQMFETFSLSLFPNHG